MAAGHPNPIGLKGADQRLRQAKQYRQKYEANWFLNLAFYQGDQWVAHDGRGLYQPRVRRGAVRLTDNRIQPIVRTEVARLTKTRPGWAATPRALDDEAVSSAQAATRLLEWAYDHLDFAQHRREAITWARVAGAGFIKTTWNPTVGQGTDVLVNGATGEAIKNPQSGRVLKPGEMPEVEAIPGVEKKTIGKGEVELAVRSPFDIFPDPLATSLEDARWIIDESVRSPEYVKDRYGVDLKADAPAQVGIVESGFHTAGVDAAAGEHVGVRVYELWEPPSASCPEGRRMAWAAGQLLYEGVNEYGEIPYVMFPGIVVPGRFWPDAVVTQLRPIQARRNKLLSQIAENLSKFGSPAVLIDKLAGIKYHGVPGETIEHNASGQQDPIKFVNPPSVPGYSFNFMEQMDSAFREISGQYEVAQGTVPAGVTAASAISLLQEQDATRLGPDVEAQEVALGKVGQMVVKNQARYYTTERIIIVVGEDGIIDVDTFRADATFQVPDVTVQPMSTFPRSIAAKQAAIRDQLNMLLQYSVPIEAGALAKILKDTQIGGLENLVASTVTDTNQAQREHVELMRGAAPQVGPVDNHPVHIACHEDFAKSPRCTPQMRDEIVNHIQEHKLAAVKKAQEDQALGALVAPPPPIVGQGGGPADSTVPTQPPGNALPQDEPPAPPAA